MLTILLGLLDVVFGSLMLMTHWGWIGNWRIALMGLVYFAGKGIAFRGSLLSALDVAAGIYFVLIMAGVKTFLVYVFFALMVYKFTVSLLMKG